MFFVPPKRISLEGPDQDF